MQCEMQLNVFPNNKLFGVNERERAIQLLALAPRHQTQPYLPIIFHVFVLCARTQFSTLLLRISKLELKNFMNVIFGFGECTYSNRESYVHIFRSG